jgi:hypothetical protein
MWNQENHFDLLSIRSENQESSGRVDFQVVQLATEGPSGPGRSTMSGQVVLYFEDQADALRFALAAGSVMAGEGAKFTSDLVSETARVTRIRLDAVNAGVSKKPNPVRVA